MRRAARHLLAVLAAALVPASAGAASFQFDDVIYDWPAEGRRSVGEDALTLGLDDQDFAIRIYRSQPGADDLQAWLAGRMAALADPDAEVEAEFPVSEQRLGGITYALGGRHVGGSLEMYFALAIGGRAQLIALDYWGGSAETELAGLVDKYVQPMLSSLRFVSAGAEPLLAPPVPGPYDGIYYAQVMGYGLNGIEIDNRFLMLSAAGYFFEDLPDGVGTQAVDYRAALGRRPDDAGTYRLDGNVIRFSYADGSGEEHSVEAAADGTLAIGGVDYMPLAPVPDGLALSGRYRNSSYLQFGPGTGLVGGAYGASSYTFSADGRFSAERSAGAFANFETSAGDLTGGFASGSDAGAASGTYRVDAGALLLTDGAGAVRRLSLVVVADGLIAVDGVVYLRGDDE